MVLGVPGLFSSPFYSETDYLWLLAPPKAMICRIPTLRDHTFPIPTGRDYRWQPGYSRERSCLDLKLPSARGMGCSEAPTSEGPHHPRGSPTRRLQTWAEAKTPWCLVWE